jgi:hypothetical protein
MKPVPPAAKSTAPAIAVFLFIASFVSSLNSADKTYSPKSSEEIEILSLVLRAEIQTNGWAKNEMICFSVEGTDPSRDLVKAIRQRGLNVRSRAEWAKKFNCGFEVQLAYKEFDLTQIMRIRTQVADLREINQGTGDLALLLRDGDYTLAKTDGKWFIRAYFPKTQGK